MDQYLIVFAMSNVQNCDFFQLIIPTVRHQFYLNNVIRTRLV